MRSPEFPKIERQKMTWARLEAVLAELGLDYQLERESGPVLLTIKCPIEHENEKEQLTRGSLLSDAFTTGFEKEKIFPLLRKINESTNLKYRILDSGHDSFIIEIGKK